MSEIRQRKNKPTEEVANATTKPSTSSSFTTIGLVLGIICMFGLMFFLLNSAPVRVLFILYKKSKLFFFN